MSETERPQAFEYERDGKRWVLTAEHVADNSDNRDADATDVQLALAELPYSARADIWCAIHPEGHVAALREAERRIRVLTGTGQLLYDMLIQWRGSDEWDEPLENSAQMWRAACPDPYGRPKIGAHLERQVENFSGSEAERDAATLLALRVLVGNVLAYAGEMPAMVALETLDRADLSELRHHAGHVAYELSEIEDCLNKLRGRKNPKGLL